MTANTPTPISVLVVDDDDMVRETLVDVLRSKGLKVTEARNGVECIQITSKQNFDVIVMDIIMPEQEGIETIAQLRRNKVTAKIIAISGGGRSKNGDFLDLARRFGAYRTFRKPFDPDRLVEEIKAIGHVRETKQPIN